MLSRSGIAHPTHCTDMFGCLKLFGSVVLAVFAHLVLGHRTPPSGAITVGNGGKYSTLQAALADNSSNVFFLYAGTYKGNTLISRSNVKIYGQTSGWTTYAGNLVSLTNNITAFDVGSDIGSATVQVEASGVSLYNLNINNTYGNALSHSPAIALCVQGDQFAGYGLKVQGYQDTLLANTGRQYYRGCWIEGAVDFIFGLDASIWITKSVIHTVGSGYITASGRSSDDSNYYVIDTSTVQGSGSTYLGRPWRNYGRVVFQNSTLGKNVNSAGWSVWAAGDPRTDHVTFAEHQNTGLGARGQRASFATGLTTPVSINTVLGSTDWIDPAYLRVHGG
ncbi:carbohydrate esterase family 8 protein [Cantharellus anzutake]|uniref:carbohydrate esterase family 8 protein n=1 Tax=Cantharellus anzutake TaxID=1750568 RepID=UPI0019080168|nr:carbohydrate esterase family 8 protein [Cantharellus anzutake]KAF8326973.1 carbohydrate esterase family 8 protein [Cantharellus anzutake]